MDNLLKIMNKYEKQLGSLGPIMKKKKVNLYMKDILKVLDTPDILCEYPNILYIHSTDIILLSDELPLDLLNCLLDNIIDLSDLNSSKSYKLLYKIIILYPDEPELIQKILDLNIDILATNKEFVQTHNRTLEFNFNVFHKLLSQDNYKDYMEIYELLLEHNTKVLNNICICNNRSPLHTLCRKYTKEDYKLLELMIKKLKNKPNLIKKLNSKDKYFKHDDIFGYILVNGLNPVHYLILRDGPVKLFSQIKININIISRTIGPLIIDSEKFSDGEYLFNL